MRFFISDESCQMHQGKSLIKSHVYLVTCPCADGMKCKAKDGIIGVSKKKAYINKIVFVCVHTHREIKV